MRAIPSKSVTADQAANLAPEKYATVVLSDMGSLPRSFEDALSELCEEGRRDPGYASDLLRPLARRCRSAG